ncbi:hypothetical protein AGMMS49949_03950 [Alphaproteobacteria bacterium]|nr:hypothetical protein AGMMS49949_03950 [Alphaproteobacteria bacterium]GHS96689.1 hypothetical protein AGMMS50296_3110 [Alphaproteobacteria bacterium]
METFGIPISELTALNSSRLTSLPDYKERTDAELSKRFKRVVEKVALEQGAANYFKELYANKAKYTTPDKVIELCSDGSMGFEGGNHSGREFPSEEAREKNEAEAESSCNANIRSKIETQIGNVIYVNIAGQVWAPKKQ